MNLLFKYRLLPWLNAAVLSMSLGACSMIGIGDSASVPPLQEFVSSGDLKSVWHYDVDVDEESIGLRPVAIGGDLIVPSSDGYISRISGGKERWKVRFDGQIKAGITVSGEYAFAVTSGGKLLALDVGTGVQKWSSDAGAEVLARPAANEQTVVVRASDSRLYAFAVNDGARLWTQLRPTPSLVLRNDNSVLLFGGFVVGGFPGGTLAAYRETTGAEAWQLTLAEPRGATEIERIADVVGEPVIRGRSICAVTFQGRVGCFDTGTGQLLWTKQASSSVGMDADEQAIYVTDEGGSIQAFAIADGSPLWHQDRLKGRTPTRPQVIGSRVIVADVQGYVHVLSTRDGSLIARAATSGRAIRQPAAPISAQSFAVVDVRGNYYGFNF